MLARPHYPTAPLTCADEPTGRSVVPATAYTGGGLRERPGSTEQGGVNGHLHRGQSATESRPPIGNRWAGERVGQSPPW